MCSQELFVLSLHFFLIFQVRRSASMSDDNFNLDMNDFLNENLMPGNLLLLDGPFTNDSLLAVEGRDGDGLSIEDDDGTFGTALSTMGFHRKMINEYLCTNFVAGQILWDQNNFISTKLQRRMGNTESGEDVLPDQFLNEGRSADKLDKVKENMLYDPGSSGYKNWLAKTTTLEDIYRHYSVQPKPFTIAENTTVGHRRNFDNDHNADDDYEEGEITGYAFQQPSKTIKPFQPLPTRTNYVGLKGGIYDHAGEYSVPATQHPITNNKRHGYDDHQVVYEDKGKEMGMKDIFEIALTTLAFLSFGMFILHVLMCITMTKTDNNLMLMPMEETDVDEIEGIAEVRRTKRSALDAKSLSHINEITRKVLKSIEAVLVAEKDAGKCLHHTICVNNNFSRNRTANGQNIWIPVWGLGMSWLSSRMMTKQPMTSSILESLKASAMGIGGADCDKMYSAGCNLQIQLKERKAVRKKRELEMYDLKMDY